ncbi:MAG: hypothetical protein ABIU63_09655 [Chitinophagaceae bacterium]
MKTVILFSAAVLFSAISFAQAPVKSENTANNGSSVTASKTGVDAQTATSTSSATAIRTSEISETKNKAMDGATQAQAAVKSAGNSTKSNIKNAGQAGKEVATTDVSVSAGTQTGMKMRAGDKNNKISENSSLNSKATVSGAGIKSAGNQVKGEGIAKVKTGAAKAKATVHAVTPKSVPVKMNAQVKTNTGIRIK